ncbi:MAG: hypothetical protein ACREKH_22025 [Candidatus Rokuibacteriota bacterium]
MTKAEVPSTTTSLMCKSCVLSNELAWTVVPSKKARTSSAVSARSNSLTRTLRRFSSSQTST